jgi:hypothetical protein
MLYVACRQQTAGRTQVSELPLKFNRSVTPVEDSERSGRPSTGKTDKDVEQVQELVLKNKRMTIHKRCCYIQNFIWVSSEHMRDSELVSG